MAGCRPRKAGAGNQRPARVDLSSLGWRERKKRRGRAYSQDSGTRGGRERLSRRPSAQAALQYQMPATFCDVSPRLPRQRAQDPPPLETQWSMARHKVNDAGPIGKRTRRLGRGPR